MTLLVAEFDRLYTFSCISYTNTNFYQVYLSYFSSTNFNIFTQKIK